MKKNIALRSTFILSCFLSLLSMVASAQGTKATGQIKSRSGATMVLQTSGSSNMTVVLTDSTQVGQKKGAFIQL